MTAIRIVKEEKRTSFLLKEFGDAIFDIKVFRIADLMIDDYKYKGGVCEYAYWDGIPFLILDVLDERDTMIVKNIFTGQSEECSKELAGLIITFFALSNQVAKGRLRTKTDLLNNLLDKIKDECFSGKIANGRDIWMTILD